MEAEFEREVLDRLIKIEEKLDGYNAAKVKIGRASCRERV